MNDNKMNKNKMPLAMIRALRASVGLYLLASLPVQAQEAAMQNAIPPEQIMFYESYQAQLNDSGELPIDPKVVYKNKPAWRYQVESGGGASTVFGFFAQPLNLEPYLPDGYLEFAIKSTAISERLLIGVGFSNDWASGERYMSYNSGSLEWTVIRIPLSDLHVPASVQRLALTTTGEPESVGMTFWISDIKLVP